jgi:hypothetical protein
MGLQPIENKALSRDIIGKSAPTLAEITIRKSQVPFDDHFALIPLIPLYIDNACGGLRIFV